MMTSTFVGMTSRRPSLRQVSCSLYTKRSCSCQGVTVGRGRGGQDRSPQAGATGRQRLNKLRRPARGSDLELRLQRRLGAAALGLVAHVQHDARYRHRRHRHDDKGPAPADGGAHKAGHALAKRQAHARAELHDGGDARARRGVVQVSQQAEHHGQRACRAQGGRGMAAGGVSAGRAGMWSHATPSPAAVQAAGPSGVAAHRPARCR